MCGRVGHAPAATRRTEAAALAREGDHAVESALVAVHAHEAVGKDPAAQEAAELALNEPGHDAVTRVGPGQEGFELRLNDPVENALLRTAADVRSSSATAGSAGRMGGNGSKRGHTPSALPGHARSAPSARTSPIPGEVESTASRSVADGCSRRQRAPSSDGVAS
jgi:hypothetical protein